MKSVLIKMVALIRSETNGAHDYTNDNKLDKEVQIT